MKREWIRAEAYLLTRRFRQVEFDPDDYLWVHIRDFDLPPGFNKRQSGLLIELDATYPFTAPKNCFIDRDIRTSSGESIDHYFPESSQNKFFSKGWAWLSLHIDNWKPNANIIGGDNLLRFCDILYLTLEGLTKQRKEG
ncbi:MAG: E2/UBC family protein [Deltaproteobacteria bacterium]